MSSYQALVLLHVIATGGLFAGLGIEVAALRRVQRAATAAEARSWLPSLQQPGGMLPHVSMIVLVLTGLGLAAQRGSLAAWMTAALAAIALMVLLLVALSSTPLDALATSLGSARDEPSGDWPRRARDPDLHWSAWLRVGLYLGVLGLMALKPATGGAIATLAAGIALGAVAAVATRYREQAVTAG